MNLAQKIKTLYPNLTNKDFGLRGTIKIHNEGSGDFIKKWQHPTYPQPNQKQLDDLENVEYKPLLTKENFRKVIKDHIDNVAKEKQYDDAYSLLSYLNCHNVKWAAEANSFLHWKTSVWEKIIPIVDQLSTSNPTIESVLSQLPKIDWPKDNNK